MNTPCGCRIETVQMLGGNWPHISARQLSEPEIVFCPLHEAAPQMYSRLASVAYYANLVANGTLNYPNEAASVSTYRREFRAISDAIRSTLVAVDKEQPADDSEMTLGPIKAPARGLES